MPIRNMDQYDLEAEREGAALTSHRKSLPRRHAIGKKQSRYSLTNEERAFTPLAKNHIYHIVNGKTLWRRDIALTL